MIKGVIFDVGGVLAYDVWEHLLCDPPGDPTSVSAKYGVPADQMEAIGDALWRAFDCRAGNPDELEKEYWDQFVERSRAFPQLTSLPIQDFLSMTDDFIRPVDPVGTTGLFEWLTNKGVHLGICSNNNEFWFRRQAQRLNLYRFFPEKNVTLSCRHGFTKSDSRLFHVAVAALGLHPVDCVFVDDRMGNVSRSIDCGMVGIFFPTEQFPAKPQRGAQYLRRVLRDLLK